MARSRPLRHYLQQDHILIAVCPYFGDLLDLASRRTLVPQFIAAAAPVPRLTGFDRVPQRDSVHPGKHQNVAGLAVLGDRRDQTVRIETRCKDVPFLQLFAQQRGGGGETEGRVAHF